MAGHHSREVKTFSAFVTTHTGGVSLCLELHYIFPVSKEGLYLGEIERREE